MSSVLRLVVFKVRGQGLVGDGVGVTTLRLAFTHTPQRNHETPSANASVNLYHTQTNVSWSHTPYVPLQTSSGWFASTLASVTKYLTTSRWPFMAAMSRGVTPFLMAHHLANRKAHTQRYASQRSRGRELLHMSLVLGLVFKVKGQGLVGGGVVVTTLQLTFTHTTYAITKHRV